MGRSQTFRLCHEFARGRNNDDIVNLLVGMKILIIYFSGKLGRFVGRI